MSAVTSAEDGSVSRSECWCCGITDDPDKLVHLGNHPEVALCLRCARWASKQADEIDDRARNGLAVMLRDRARFARRVVVQRGWHQLPLVGGVLRKLGRYAP
jgi:hypothetical protein